MARFGLLLCVMVLSLLSLLGCSRQEERDLRDDAGAMRGLAFTLAQQAEERGDLHEAENHYLLAIEWPKKEGYVRESLYEDLHRVQEKLQQKYGR